MSKSRTIGAVILVFSILPATGRAGPVWSTGFEGGFPSGASVTGHWTVIGSSASAHSGSDGADVVGSTDPGGDVLSLPISSVGFQGLGLEYWFKVRSGLEVDDQVAVEWTPDGAIWQTLAAYTNQVAGDWQLATFDLPADANDNPNLALRLVATLSSSGDRMNFDDIVITGTAVPEPTTLGLLMIGAVALLRHRHQAR